MSDEEGTEYRGRAIASLCAAQGMRCQDLKARSGLSYPYIAEIENGSKNSPSLKAITAIAGALGVTPVELQTRAADLRNADRRTHAAAEPETRNSPGMAYTTPFASGYAPELPRGERDDVAERLTAQVLAAVAPRLEELVARKVRIAVKEELPRRREAR